MKLLLDTHTALWWLGGDARLSRPAAKLLETDGDVELLVSAVVAWEIGVKRSMGKLDVTGDVVGLLLEGGARPLPITLAHAAAVEHLPWHHRDPFDRMLVAQAQLEGAVLVSGDPALRRYGVPVVW